MFVKTFSRLLLRLTVQPPGEQRTLPAPRTLAIPITAYITAAHWAGSLSKSYN